MIQNFGLEEELLYFARQTYDNDFLNKIKFYQ